MTLTTEDKNNNNRRSAPFGRLKGVRLFTNVTCTTRVLVLNLKTLWRPALAHITIGHGTGP